MKPFRLFISALATIALIVQRVSSEAGYSYDPPHSGGYVYSRPNNPLVYPGENDIDSRGRSKVIFGTAEDNINSDLILDRGAGRTRVIEEEVIVQERPRSSGRERVEVVEQVVERAPPPPAREVVEEVIYDDAERDSGVTREDALNSGGNLENIQDVRDRANNEVVREEVVEERQRFVSSEGSSGGSSSSGGTEERFVEGGSTSEGGFSETEAGSSISRRRTSFRGNQRKSDRDRRRGDDRRGSSSSTRSRYTKTRDRIPTTTRRPLPPPPRVEKKQTFRESTRASGSSNREIANKAYGIGRKNDEAVSGSSARGRLLEQSFRKDLKAPNYNSVPDDENFNVRSNSDRDFSSFRSSSSSNRNSVSSSAPRKSYSSNDEIDDDDFRNAIVRTTTTTTSRPIFREDRNQSPESVENEKAIDSSQLIEGGSFAASNNDQVVSRGSSSNDIRTTTYRSSSSNKNSYGSLDDDTDGSPSSLSLRILLDRLERKRREGLHPFISEPEASGSDSFSFRASGRGVSVDPNRLPPHYHQLMTGTPSQVADLTKSTYMYTRTGPICPSGGCVISALSAAPSSHRGDFLDYKPTSSITKYKAPNHFEHL